MRVVTSKWPHRERGAAAILFAVALPLLLMVSAFVVDFGYAYYSKQRLQDALDLAAIAAAGELDGSDSERTNARSAAINTLIDNGFSAESLEAIDLGNYSPARALGSRFQASSGAMASANAVRLLGISQSPRFFSRIIATDPLDLGVVSTAITTGRYATVRIASGLANLDEGLLNALLGALLGGNVNLSALDYKGLVGANIELLSFLDAYAVKVGATVGDYDGLLSADASVLGVLGLVAELAQNAYDGASSAIDLGVGLGDAFPGINKLPLLQLQDVNLTLGELLGVGLGNDDAGLEVPVNVFDLVTASILAASNATNATGEHPVLVSLNTFLGASLELSITEQPQPPLGFRRITEEDIRNGDNILRTAQIRLLLSVDWQGALSGVITVVNGLLDLLQVVGLDVDLLPTYGPNANDNLSIGVAVAPSQVRVTKLGCEPVSTADRFVGMDIDTGLASAHVGQIDPVAFLSNNAPAEATPFNLLGLSYNLWGLIEPPIEILSVDLGINLSLGAPQAPREVKGGDTLDPAVFPDIYAFFSQAGHPADTADFPSGTSVGTSGIISNLGDDLKDGLGLQLSGVVGDFVLQPLVDLVTLIGGILIGDVLGPLLDGIVDLLLDTLGVRVGTAEVAVIDLQCGSARLVHQ